MFAVNTLGDEMKSRSPRFPNGIGEKSHRSAPVSASSATRELEKPVLPAPIQSPKSAYTAPFSVSIAADDVMPMMMSSVGMALLHRDGTGHAEREVDRAIVGERTCLREGVLVGRPAARQQGIVTPRVGRGAELVVRVPVGPAHDAVTGAPPHPAHRVTDLDGEIGGRVHQRP